jgi:hypothetical protein
VRSPFIRTAVAYGARLAVGRIGGTFDAVAIQWGNAMETAELLDTSDIRTAQGRYPSQIVLRRVKEKTYATHLKIIPPDGEPYFILGTYFFKLDEAKADFAKRKLELEGWPES